MKRIYFVFLCVFMFSACKKTVENIAEDIIVQAMTDGQWVITSFTRNGADITADFSPYKFQYHSNRTVDAIKNGSVEKTGLWEGNALAQSISADFSGAVHPLVLINGNWLITKNSWTFVEAMQTNIADIKTLRLEKK